MNPWSSSGRSSRTSARWTRSTVVAALRRILARNFSSRAAANVRVALRATRTASGSRSKPRATRPSRRAAISVVPEPAIGSSTVASGLVVAPIRWLATLRGIRAGKGWIGGESSLVAAERAMFSDSRARRTTVSLTTRSVTGSRGERGFANKLVRIPRRDYGRVGIGLSVIRTHGERISYSHAGRRLGRILDHPRRVPLLSPKGI